MPPYPSSILFSFHYALTSLLTGLNGPSAIKASSGVLTFSINAPPSAVMPVPQLYTVIGDANVRRNMTAMNVASREAMTTARVIDCSDLASFAQALQQVSQDTTVCLVQCLTSFLVAANDAGTIFGTVDPVIGEFSNQLRGFSASRGNLQVLVAPPMYRPFPVWYRNHLPEVAQQFSSLMSANRSRNLHLLTSSVVQDLLPDGLHLTPVAGLHYLLHLFDDAHRILTSLTSKGKALLS